MKRIASLFVTVVFTAACLLAAPAGASAEVSTPGAVSAAKAQRDAVKAQIEQLKIQIKQLKAQRKAATDPALKKSLTEQIKSLKAQKRALKMQIKGHGVSPKPKQR